MYGYAFGIKPQYAVYRGFKAFCGIARQTGNKIGVDIIKPALARKQKSPYGILRRVATAYIFKDVSEDDSQEACYEMVEDEDEMQAVFKVFEQMLDDVDLEM